MKWSETHSSGIWSAFQIINI